MRTHYGSVRHRLQNCTLSGMRMPDRTYPHNPKWRYRSARDKTRLQNMIKRYRQLCDELEAVLGG